jgi:menaquinone-dependent protoporphyrinogen IX oxidase
MPMWYLYLDESGDLGFDFVNKKPSNFFTVCILATSDREAFLQLGRAVRKTLHRKLKKPKSALPTELKGTNTTLEVKRYFYRLVKEERFGLYAVTLNKRRVYERLTREKARVYNFIARQVLDLIPFEKAAQRVQLVIDKSKGKPEIAEFNSYITRQLEGRINPKTPLSIDHLDSGADKVLQAVDLFCWGIFRKYERRDTSWFEVFEGKIILETPYL